MDIRFDIVKATTEMCREIALVKKSVWESSYRGIYPDTKIDGFAPLTVQKPLVNLVFDEVFVWENEEFIFYIKCCVKSLTFVCQKEYNALDFRRSK